MTTTAQNLTLSGCKVALVLNGASGKADAHANEDKIRE